MKLARCWPLVLASACRIGGPSGDPTVPIEFANDAADAADASSAPAESGGDDAFDAGVPPDATTTNDASPDASTQADARGADAFCAPLLTDAGACNPVTNTGCTLGQCDIDTTQMTPTGACVIASPFPNDAGSPCTQVSGSVSCHPQFTCFGGTCQRLCFCNADCDNNTCCSGRAGTTGFGLCGACP